MLFTRRELNRLVWPLIGEQILAVTVGMADTVMVAYCGEAAMSGVALSDSISFLLLQVFAALCTGGAVVVSQHLGRGDADSAGRAAGHLVWLTGGVAVVMAAAGLWFREPLLRGLFGGVEEEVMRQALAYFTIISFSFPFLGIYNAGAALLRSIGATGVSLWIAVLMNGINVAGNAWLIYGRGMGAAGAAVASLVARAVAAVVIFAFLWHFFRRKRRWGVILTAAVLGFSLLYGSLHLSLTKYAQWDVDSNLIAETYDSVEDVAAALPDDAFYRIDAYGAHNNLGLWFNRSCLQFFNSTVAPSIMAFYPEVGVKRDVNSKPDAENYALRGLLSVRYTLVAKDKETEWTDKDLPGWQRTGETDAYALYENENWVPMGFTYDCYVTADQLERVSEEERAQILCRAILLDDDQISAFGSLLEPLPDEELTNRGEDAYAADCAARRAAGVAAFTATDTGFTAKTAYDADELVFFSVPYDDGFSATVNGEPAAIEKVDDGLMAVYVPAGENEIEFTYHTPGLKVSACVSAAAIAVYGVYLLGIIIKRKSQPGSKR